MVELVEYASLLTSKLDVFAESDAKLFLFFVFFLDFVNSMDF